MQPMDVRNAFSESIFLGAIPINEQKKFMELKTDRIFKLKFIEIELTNVWLHVKNDSIESVLLQCSYHLPQPSYENRGFQLVATLKFKKNENA